MTYPRLAVIGSRKTPESSKPILFKLIDQFRAKYPIEAIVSGGAQGPDFWSEEYSRENKISRFIYEPNWYPDGRDKKMNKGAGFLRNKQIIENCDYCIAMIKIGEAKGTMNSIEWCQRLKRPYMLFDHMGKILDHNKYEEPLILSTSQI